MNLEQILISALDAEIEEYEKVLNFLPEPSGKLISDKFSPLYLKYVDLPAGS